MEVTRHHVRKFVAVFPEISSVVHSIGVKIVEWYHPLSCYEKTPSYLYYHQQEYSVDNMLCLVSSESLVWIVDDVSDDENISAVLLMFGSVPRNTWGELATL